MPKNLTAVVFFSLEKVGEHKHLNLVMIKKKRMYF